jgi:hypothetical protein
VFTLTMATCAGNLRSVEVGGRAREVLFAEIISASADVTRSCVAIAGSDTAGAFRRFTGTRISFQHAARWLPILGINARRTAWRKNLYGRPMRPHYSLSQPA